MSKMSEAEKEERAFYELIAGKYAPKDLDGKLRIVVAHLRDGGKNIPKDYYVQPLMRLIEQETSSARIDELKTIDAANNISISADLEMNVHSYVVNRVGMLTSNQSKEQ